MKIKKINIGILGGSFDPAHKGHLLISKEALKKFNLNSIWWVITNQNPFKKKSFNDLNKRMIICKKIIGKNRSIKIKYFEDIIESKKTIDLINYLYKKKRYEFFFFDGGRQFN